MKKLSLVVALVAGLASTMSAQAAQTITGKVTSIMTQDGWPGSIDPNGSGTYYTFVRVTPSTTSSTTGTPNACVSSGKAGWFAIPVLSGENNPTMNLLQAAYISGKVVTIAGSNTGSATTDCWWGYEKALRVTLQ
jgi:hypothetical protein